MPKHDNLFSPLRSGQVFRRLWAAPARFSLKNPRATGVCEQNIPPEKNTSERQLSRKHQIRGWRAVSAAGLRGLAKASERQEMFFFTDTGMASLSTIILLV